MSDSTTSKRPLEKGPGDEPPPKRVLLDTTPFSASTPMDEGSAKPEQPADTSAFSTATPFSSFLSMTKQAASPTSGSSTSSFSFATDPKQSPFQFGGFKPLPSFAELAKQASSASATSAPATPADENKEKSDDDFAPLNVEPVTTGDPTLAAVDLPTGEENEDTLMTVPGARLLEFAQDDAKDNNGLSTFAWKTRGEGSLKVNCHKESKSCRLLLRNAATHKAVLNVSLPGCHFAALDPKQPGLRFSSIGEDSKPKSYCLRLVKAKCGEYTTEFVRTKLVDFQGGKLDPVEDLNAAAQPTGTKAPNSTPASSPAAASTAAKEAVPPL
eukprot:NODE_2066_length_1146_cov_54.278705_g2049_i0.p1 GENE.NODE_2066_length_1146_cov_54.278705_g2049_i0~~NODE_2066_length_1146_cov_54.278705_g2049_i0.p1  ORF type:complete len:327 (+),score=65.10 NODE_2066_length_1146_cov_54.278705_g2049_i0:80-1060(+)